MGHRERGRERRRAQEARVAGSRSWLLLRAASWWLGGVWRGWRDAPGAARWAWLVPVCGGTLLAAGLSMALAWWLGRSAQSGPLAGERAWLERFIERVPLEVGSAIYLGVPGDTVFLALVVVAGSALALRAGRPFLALAYLAAMVVADLAIGAAWLVWDRPRPELVIGGAASPGLRSFPSGHVAQALAIYGLSAWLWLRASPSPGERALALGLLLALIALVGTTRLELGVHWPSDVAASLLLGAILALGLALGVERAEARAGRRRPGRSAGGS